MYLALLTIASEEGIIIFPIFQMRTLRPRGIFVSYWVTGKHWDYLMYRMLIRKVLGLTLVEEKH